MSSIRYEKKQFKVSSSTYYSTFVNQVSGDITKSSLKDLKYMPVARKLADKEYELEYIVVEPGKQTTFYGFNLDTDSGYLSFNRYMTGTFIAMCNLYEILDKCGISSNYFLNGLEQYKFNEITAEQFIDYLNKSVTVQQGSKIKNLLKGMNSTAKILGPADDFFDFFNPLPLFANRYFSLYQYAASDPQSFLGGDLATTFSYKVNDNRNRYDYMTGRPAEDIDLLSNSINPAENRKMSKSERVFYNALDLLQYENTDYFLGDRIATAISLDPDNIKEIISKSPLKETVNGAVLSGLIRKSAVVKATIDKSLSGGLTGDYVFTRYLPLPKFSYYIKTAQNKVKF